VCDPPRQAAGDFDPHYVTLSQALQADILCCHTPLTTAGPWPTQHLIQADPLCALPPHAIVLNAGRGGVISTPDLQIAMQQRPDIRFILDVWDPEPELPLEVCAQARIATGHIAGYSLEGRLRGTQMIRAALSQACQLPESPVTLSSQLPQVKPLALADVAADPWRILQQAVLQVCDPWGDDQRFREALAAVAAEQRGTAFDGYRRHYVQQRPARRELSSVPVTTAHLSGLTADLLAAAGFACQ
jgi:erythronate-4-phosphate dehydrogenase